MLHIVLWRSPREASKYIKYTLAMESERNTYLSADEILRNFGGFENNMLQTFVNYGGVEGPPHIFFDIMLSHTDDIVTRP